MIFGLIPEVPISFLRYSAAYRLCRLIGRVLGSLCV